MDKVTLDKRYDKILKEKINRRSRSKDPLKNALDKIFDASDLLEIIHKKIKNRRLIQEARKQFVITSVTAMEVLLKDYFIKLLSNFEIMDKFPEYIEKKYSIEDLDYFEDKNISNEEIICNNYNFQNISQINNAYSKALSLDAKNPNSFNFFNELKEYKWWYDKKDKRGYQKLGEFYQKLDKVISLRHDFVHDINFRFRLNKDEVEDIDSFCVFFMSQLGFFMEDQIKRLKKEKIKI